LENKLKKSAKIAADKEPIIRKQKQKVTQETERAMDSILILKQENGEKAKREKLTVK